MLACRPMLSFALAVMAGAVAARHWPDALSHSLYGWLLLLLAALWFASRPRRPPEAVDSLPAGYAEHILPRPGVLAGRGLNRFVLIAGVGFFLLAMARQDAWRERVSPGRLPERRWFDASLLALAPSREHLDQEGGWRIPALLLAADGEDAGGVAVLLSGPDGPPFRRGDVLHARIDHRPSRVREFPTAFDFPLWLERDGLAASVAVARPRRADDARPRYTVAAVDDVSLYTRARRLIDAVRARAISLTLRHGGEHGPVLAAMLYGYRKDLESDLRDSFRRVGIGHVLAISGLHVGLIVGLLWWMSGWLRWSSRRRAIACLALAVVYLGLSGGQVAASRATLMAVIHLAGIAWGRKSDMLNSLGAAAFILVLLNPSAPLDVSFQLSFTAVVFIYAALDRQPGRRQAGGASGTAFRRRLATELSSLVKLSVTTWVGLFPIIALVFNQVNLIGLPINIVVIPLMSLVLAGGLLLPWLGWLPGAGWLLALPARFLTWLAHAADGLSFSSFPANAPGSGWMAVFYAFAVAFLLRGMAKAARTRRLWTGVACGGMAAAFVAMICGMGASPPPPGGRIAVLPGAGMGVLAVEAEGGGVALIGTLSRGGMTAAEWLHYRRRGGGVRVVAVGEPDGDELSPLAYHYPIIGLTRLSPVAADDAGQGSWLPVPDAPDIEYAYSRDARGRVVWLAARTGGMSACVAPRLAARQWEWRLERRTPGHDADLLVVGFRGKPPEGPMSPTPSGTVAVSGRASDLPPGWIARSRYGVIEVTAGGRLSGFDGRAWKELP